MTAKSAWNPCELHTSASPLPSPPLFLSLLPSPRAATGGEELGWQASALGTVGGWRGTSDDITELDWRRKEMG